MNDDDRMALRRRILERLGWNVDEHVPPGGTGSGDCRSPPDHTRDANAALRDLAPLIPGLIIPVVRAHKHKATGEIEARQFCLRIPSDGPIDEAVALTLCMAVDALA